MKRQGWWRQLQNNNYPETKKNYGHDTRALDPRLLQKNIGKSSVHVAYILYCKSCCHEKLLTDEFMEELRKHISPNIPDFTMNNLQQNLRRLKCSCCGEKDIAIFNKEVQQNDSLNSMSIPNIIASERLPQRTTDHRRCQYCGRLAMTGDNVCYTCAG
jgi:hypothetical protein